MHYCYSWTYVALLLASSMGLSIKHIDRVSGLALDDDLLVLHHLEQCPNRVPEN